MIEVDRRTYIRAMGATGAAVGLAGCSNSSSWERDIAIATPQTGPIGWLGESIIQGSELGIEAVNEQSDQEDISLTTADTAGNVEDAQSVVQNSIEEGSVAIAGTISSDVAISIRDLLEEEEVPHITPIAGAPEITQPGTNFSFRFFGDEEQKEFGQLQFLSEEGVSNVAIIGADYSYPRTTVEFFREYAPEFDISLQHVSFVPLGTDNFQPELNEFSDDEVDAIFLPYPGANGVTLIQQIREAGLFENNIVLGDIGYGSVPFLSALQEDIVGVNHWGSDWTTSGAQQVAESVPERYDTRAHIYHTIAYDTVQIVGRAINSADSLDPVAVRDAIRDIEYEAASGWTVTFDEDGHCETYQLIINQWGQENGEFVRNNQFKSDVIPPEPSP